MFSDWRNRSIGLVLGGAAMLALLAGPAAAMTLDEAVSIAIKTNPTVLSADERTRAANEIIRQARAGFLPRVDLRSSVHREAVDSPNTGFVGRTQTGYENELALRQPTFRGLRTQNDMKAARAQHEGSAQRAMSARFLIAVRAINAYLGIARNRELEAIAARNVADHERTLRLVEQRARTGAGVRADVEQARARLHLARASYEQIVGELRLAEADFREAVGQPADREMLVPTLPAADLPRSTGIAFATAVERNPDILADESRIRQARAGVNIERADFMPSIDIELVGNLDDDNLQVKPRVGLGRDEGARPVGAS